MTAAGVVTLLVTTIASRDGGVLPDALSARLLGLAEDVGLGRGGSVLAASGAPGVVPMTFARVSDAVAATRSLHHALLDACSGVLDSPALRMALHAEELGAGDAALRAAVDRGAALCAIADAGEVIVSPVAAALIRDRMGGVVAVRPRERAVPAASGEQLFELAAWTEADGPTAGRPSAPVEDHAPAPLARAVGRGAGLPTGVVTFLLTDIEQSTALWDRQPALMATWLARHDDLVQAAVRIGEGHVLKDRGEGDASLSVFGRATGAVLAATELQRLIDAEPWPPELPVRVRAAIHTGEAYERDGDYYGPAVNRGARLRALAAGGDILVSQATAELVVDHLPDDVDLADVGHHELPGIVRGERVFQVVDRRRTAPPRPALVAPVAGTLPPTLPELGRIAGRLDQRERLHVLWKEAVAGGVRIVLVAGEPGIGKTSLAAATARDAADDGAVVLHGRCDHDLAAPYQPFIEALRRYVAAVDTQLLAAELGPGATALARILPELGPRGVPRPGEPGLEPESEQFRLFESVVRLLSLATAETPAVIVLDDLHWADQASLLLLRYLARAADPMRLLVIGTYRDTELSRGHPLGDVLADLRRERTVERLALGGLAVESVNELVEWFAGHDVSRAFAEFLTDHTGGNPFFLEEVLRELAVSGAVYQESDGRWRTSTDVRELMISEGVREVVGRRVGALDDEVQRCLTLAAVVGREFSIDVLVHVSDLDEDAVLDALDGALAAGIIVEVVNRPGRYAFSHAMIREVLYTDVPSWRRVRLHGRVAEALEQTRGATTAELAHHHSKAATPDAGVDKAVAYAQRAGHEAVKALAYDDAVAYFDRALELAGGAGPIYRDTLIELHLAAGESRLRAGDTEGGQRILLEGAAIARRDGTSEQLARIALAYPGLTVSEIGIVTAGVVDEPTITLLTEALDRLPPGDSALKALVLACLGRALITRPEECRRHLDDAVAMARRLGDPACLGRALGFLHILAAATPDFDARRKMVREITALAAATQDPILRLRAYLSGMVDALDAGDIGTADDFRLRYESLAVDLKTPRQIMLAAWHKVMRALLDGRLDDVPALADEALAQSTAVAWGGGAQAWGVVNIALAIERGEVAAWSEAVAAFAAEYELPAWRAALAYVRATAGDTDGARRLIRELVHDGTVDLPFDRNWLIGAALLTDAAALVGDAAAAAVLRAALVPHAERMIVVNEALLYVYGSVHRVLGVAAATSGDLDGAVDELDAAVELESRVGAVARLAHTRVLLADMLTRRGRDEDRDRARRLLIDGTDVARQLRMSGVLVTADVVASRLR